MAIVVVNNKVDSLLYSAGWSSEPSEPSGRTNGRTDRLGTRQQRIAPSPNDAIIIIIIRESEHDNNNTNRLRVRRRRRPTATDDRRPTRQTRKREKKSGRKYTGSAREQKRRRRLQRRQQQQQRSLWEPKAPATTQQSNTGSLRERIAPSTVRALIQVIGKVSIKLYYYYY